MRHAENNAARRNDIQKPIVLSSTKNHSAISEDIAPTLTADMDKTKYVPITVTEKRFYQWYEDDKSVTIRHDSGSYGGGSEVLVIQTLAEASATMTTRESTVSMQVKEN